MAVEPPPLLPHEERLPPRTDLWIAAAALVFSAAILVLSWQMPTYTDQGGQIYIAPGFVPSFYGLVIGILGIWLAVRSIRAGALAPAGAHRERRETGNSNARLVLAAGLGILFVVGLIGRMPFWLAATFFVTLFVAAFEWRPGVAPKTRARQFLIAFVIGLSTGILVTLVFERVFLVRLP
jgi:Tripartite tricarboxylate transporter TctB family